MNEVKTSEGSGIMIAVAEACAYVDGRKLHLTPRENDVATAIAINGRPISTDALLERVWPEQDPDRTRLCLKVYVHRLRSHFGSRSVVLCERSRWSFRADVRVDILEWKRLTRSGPSGFTLQQLAELQTAYEKLSDGIPDILTRSALIGPVEHLFGQVLTSVGSCLLEDALRRRSFSEAFVLARELVRLDPHGAGWHDALQKAQTNLLESRLGTNSLLATSN